MHESSFDKMRRFREKYLTEWTDWPLRIFDLGSMDVNGSYRPLFDAPDWQYQGIDMAEGPNVDIILKNPYKWSELPSKSADVVISGQALEHIQYFWVTLLEVARVLKPGGLCCIIAPSSGYEHRYPVDCYRYYRDGFMALAHFARLETREVFVQSEPDPRYVKDDSNTWKDAVMICRKPHLSFVNRIKADVRRLILHRAHMLCM